MTERAEDGKRGQKMGGGTEFAAAPCHPRETMFRVLLLLTVTFGIAVAIFIFTDSPIIAFAVILLAAPVVVGGVMVLMRRRG